MAKRYKVQLVSSKTVPVYFDCEVEAEDEEQAEERAVQMADGPGASWSHGDGMYDGEWEVLSAEEVPGPGAG